MADDPVIYRGFQIDLQRHGSGWQARIYPPGSKTPMMEIPETRDEDAKRQLVREARAIVDRRIAILPTRALVPTPAMPMPRRRWRDLLGLGPRK